MENKEIKILYLDDQQINLDTFKATFRTNYKIFTALSASDAFEILNKNDIHIAIADQRMPDLSGVQFFEAIMPKYPKVIRVLLTGYVDVEAVIEAINTGRIFRYVRKPWEASELKLVLDGAAKLCLVERENELLITKMEKDLVLQQQMIDLLKNYVPTSVVDRVSSGGKLRFPLEGENRVLSVLFMEIINFSSLIQNLTVTQSLHLLDDFFSTMSKVIVDNKGFLNNFLGGGLIALFGAPVSHMDNTANAIRCALEMVQQIDSIASLHNLPITLAIGINTGEALVGNTGSKNKLIYTVYGNVPKIASQLVNIGKTQPNQILITESTYESAKSFLASKKVKEMVDAGIKYYTLLNC